MPPPHSPQQPRSFYPLTFYLLPCIYDLLPLTPPPSSSLPPQVSDPSVRLAFLQQMLAFAQHPYLLLADKALPFWAKLLQVGGAGGRGRGLVWGADGVLVGFRGVELWRAGASCECLCVCMSRWA